MLPPVRGVSDDGRKERLALGGESIAEGVGGGCGHSGVWRARARYSRLNTLKQIHGPTVYIFSVNKLKDTKECGEFFFLIWTHTS